MFVEEAPPAINTSHVKAESNKKGTGFVELMGGLVH